MASQLDMGKFRVTAIFDYPPINRSSTVMAGNAESAILRAVIDGKIPIDYQRDHQKCLQPIYWQPQMGGSTRWPQVRNGNQLIFEKYKPNSILRIETEEI